MRSDSTSRRREKYVVSGASSLAEAQNKQHETAGMQFYAGMADAAAARLYALRGENRNAARAGVRAREHFLRAKTLDVSLADARDRRTQARKVLAAGNDPSEVKKEAKRLFLPGKTLLVGNMVEKEYWVFSWDGSTLKDTGQRVKVNGGPIGIRIADK